MIDLLIVALIYAILKVCDGVSLNVISSTVFDKPFPNCRSKID
jgi:hypothetical protein